MKSVHWALLPLLTATLTTTMANTVVNVPMTSILSDLHAPLTRGVLVATAFPVTLAALMPLSGWLGDRFGHRRVLCAAMLCMVVGAGGAALAPNLPVLVAFRMVQGLAAAPVLPLVMVLVVQVLGEERRGRALSLWAAANGAGQALGPTTGGLLSELFGWQAVFWQIVPLAVLVVLGGRLLLLPDDRTARRPRPDWPGALTITGTAALSLVSMSAVPSQGVTSPMVWGTAVAGLLALVTFVLVERGRPAPFLRPRHLLELRYLRSSAAAGTQMFTLGAVLLAAPAYLVGTRGMAESTTGLAVLALPLAMMGLATPAGRATERFGGRPVMICGLCAMVIALVLLAVATGRHAGSVPVVASLALAGAGVAFVQTPAATGASRSKSGRTGAGLGLFSTTRFGASALGAAYVAFLGTSPPDLVRVYATCAALIAAAAIFATTKAGSIPAVGHRPTRGAMEELGVQAKPRA